MIYENKMYVVIGVLLIILLGLFIYLIFIDLKLRRIEKNSVITVRIIKKKP